MEWNSYIDSSAFNWMMYQKEKVTIGLIVVAMALMSVAAIIPQYAEAQDDGSLSVSQTATVSDDDSVTQIGQSNTFSDDDIAVIDQDIIVPDE